MKNIKYEAPHYERFFILFTCRFLGPNILLNAIFTNILNLCSFLVRVKVQVLHLYQIYIKRVAWCLVVMKCQYELTLFSHKMFCLKFFCR
jgi:hypothetical protein